MFIPPPALLYNKWYFQKELANYPLVMFLSAAMSLDRYYLSASSVSETMGFTSLNTDFFKLHNWKAQTPNPYKPQEELYILTTGTVTKQWTETPLKNMILCGNTLEHTLGLTFDEVQKVTPGTGTASNWDTVVQTYLSKKVTGQIHFTN